MFQMILALCLVLLMPASAGAGEQPAATMYKRPYCGCCDGHAEHLRKNGYAVTVVETEDLPGIKKKYKVPQEFEGCHTILIDGYVIEGHVPATIIRKLLKERPAIRGIALPGMPDGSPGMSGQKSEPFTFYEISDGAPKVYTVE